QHGGGGERDPAGEAGAAERDLAGGAAGGALELADVAADEAAFTDDGDAGQTRLGAIGGAARIVGVAAGDAHHQHARAVAVGHRLVAGDDDGAAVVLDEAAALVELAPAAGDGAGSGSHLVGAAA